MLICPKLQSVAFDYALPFANKLATSPMSLASLLNDIIINGTLTQGTDDDFSGAWTILVNAIANLPSLVACEFNGNWPGDIKSWSVWYSLHYI